MAVESLIELIKLHPEEIQFEQVMDIISTHYQYTPTQFTNGLNNDQIINKAGENEGSCKIFSFAKINELSELETLACFGKYYRQDVLEHKDASDHANIRTFMKHGWSGIVIEDSALTPK